MRKRGKEATVRRQGYSLPKELVERLRAAVPYGDRSVFVSEAIKEKLDREQGGD